MAQTNVLSTIPLFRVLLCVLQVFLFHKVIHRVGRLYGYLTRSSSQGDFEDLKKAHVVEKVTPKRLESKEDKDMERVMENLGIFLDPQGEKFGFFDDLTNIFEEKEPGLDEVKEAFDVFDENKDGFVDEGELQRVLCNLGLKEALEVQNCRRMISRYDENGDGKIDFKEFVKIMENTFC